MKQRKKYSNHRTKHKSNRRPNRRTKRKSNRRHNRRTNRRTNRRQIRKNMRGGMWAREITREQEDLGLDEDEAMAMALAASLADDAADWEPQPDQAEAAARRRDRRRGEGRRGEPAAPAPAPAPAPAATKVDCPACNAQSWDGGARERDLPGGFCEECRGPRAERCTACSHDLCKTCLYATKAEPAEVVAAPAPAPTPFQFTSYPSDTVSLDKFYEVSPTDPNKYRLNIDKINLISCHGFVRPDGYTLVPKGLTLYLFVPEGKALQLDRKGSGTPLAPVRSSSIRALEYIRPYTEGGIIQEQDLFFNPVYRRRQKRGPEGTTFTSTPWRIRGLLKGFLPEDWKTMDISERGRALLSIPGSGDHFEKDLEQVGPYSDPYNHMKHKDRYFEHNMDDIIPKEYLAEKADLDKPIKLSYVLAKIAEAREEDPSISADWFGGFCRLHYKGRLGDALNIETLKRCEVEGLPSLPPNFFDSDVSFEGASDELRHQSSLASKSETANFMNTVNELVEYSKTKDFPEIGGGKSLLTTIARKLDSAEPTLEPDEVCFIFQMKQLIKEQEHL